MSRELSSHPIEVTGYAFDDTQRGYPTRINIHGRSVNVERGTVDGTLSFQHDGVYFWIQRSKSSWVIQRWP